MNPLIQGASFLLSTLFHLYLLLLMLRVLLQMVQANFHNPLCRFVVTATNPPLLPLRRIIPGLWGIDLAAVLLIIALKMLELVLLAALSGSSLRFPGLCLLTLVQTLELLLNVYLFSLIIQAIASWINPHAQSPITEILFQLTEPVLRPIRRRLPPMSGLDFSPLVVLLALMLINIVLISPLLALGAQWAV